MPVKRADAVVLLAVLGLLLGFSFTGCSTDGVSNGKDKVYFFFSPKCPHCEKVMPYVKNASEKMEIKFCQVGKMDDECDEIAKKIGLKGVPTAVYKKENELKVYIGEIQVKDFMLEITGGG
ncbi:MAG: thioredoxin family protein [Archaeoglobus sp.]|nr:thioredoxin family protein [Archaeoglobus sp.]